MGQLGLACGSRLPGRGHHAQPLPGVLFNFAFPVREIQRLQSVVALLILAQAEQNVRRAGDQHHLLFAQPVKRRHVFILRIKRNFTTQLAGLRRQGYLRRQHFQCPLGGAAGNFPQPAFLFDKLAVVTQIDSAQIALKKRSWRHGDRRRVVDGMDFTDRLIAVPFHPIDAVRGDHRLHRHFVHGQGPGFIRADNGHRTEGFHRRQLADNRFLTGHRLHAERQNNRDDRRQPFRDRRHREANQRQHQFGDRHIAEQQAKDEQRRHHHQNEDKNGFAQLIHLHQQRRAMFLNARHHLVDVAQLGIAAGGHHDPFPRP